MTDEKELKEEQCPEEEVSKAEEAEGGQPEAEAAENGGKAEDVKPEEGEAVEEKAEEAEEKPSPEDEDLQTKFLRLSADFQNYRRRTEKEKSDIYAFANEKIVLQLLDVLDNFDRAMQTAPDGDKFAEGMGLILKQFTDLLDRNNVAEIEALGKSFDPNYHNAVMTEAVEDTESGIITKVLQKGYTLNGKVIRPSMVAVSQ